MRYPSVLSISKKLASDPITNAQGLEFFSVTILADGELMVPDDLARGNHANSHTMATDLLNASADIVTIQYLLES